MRLVVFDTKFSDFILQESQSQATLEKTMERQRKTRCMKHIREQQKAQSPPVRVRKVLSGTKSQNLYNAPACLPNSLAAICNPVDPAIWTPHDVDSMLLVGFKKIYGSDYQLNVLHGKTLGILRRPSYGRLNNNRRPNHQIQDHS